MERGRDGRGTPVEYNLSRGGIYDMCCQTYLVMTVNWVEFECVWFFFFFIFFVKKKIVNNLCFKLISASQKHKLKERRIELLAFEI